MDQRIRIARGFVRDVCRVGEFMPRTIVAVIFLVLPVPLVSTLGVGQKSSCVGDCDGDDNVSIDELVQSLSIALEVSPLSNCESIDANGDGSVTVHELVEAVHQSMTHCGRLTQLPTVTRTTTVTPSRTRTPTSTPPPSGVPLGSEFQVNTYTPFSQFEPVIALNPDGGFTVAWAGDGQDECPAPGRDECCTEDQCSDGETCACCFPNAKRCLASGITCLPGDCPRFGVFGQRFVKDGTALSTEFQVNSYAAELQFQPDIDTNTAGFTVVVWQSREQDGSGMGIFGQRYNADGPLGEEFLVNSMTAGDQVSPEVAVTEAHDFVVTWSSVGGDGSGSAVFARRFASNGNAVGNDFQVNMFTPADQFEVTISDLDNNETIIAWSSQEQDGSADGVFAQRYDSTGGRIGREFQINTYTLSAQRNADVAGNPVGGFVVTWASASQDGESAGIFGQRFEPSAQAIDGEFQVNTYTHGSQLSPSVTVGPVGDFVAVWTSYAQDGHCDGVFGQRFDPMGVRAGTEFLVNTYTSSCEFGGRLVPADGGFVVVWVGDYQDGPSSGVFGQRFAW